MHMKYATSLKQHMNLNHVKVLPTWTSGAEKLHSLSEPPRILLHHLRRKYLQPEQDMF